MQFKYPVEPEEDYLEVIGDSSGWQSFLVVTDSTDVTCPLGTYTCLYYLSLAGKDSAGRPVLTYEAPGLPYYGIFHGDLYNRVRFSARHYVRPGLGVVKAETRGVEQYGLLQEWVLTAVNITDE